MDYQPRPLLRTIVQTALEGTGATAGWLVTPVDDAELAVVAVAGDGALVERALWQRSPLGTGLAGMVLQSGQPVALVPTPGSSADPWSAALLGREPVSVLCVPCHDEDHLAGVLQLVDRAGGGPFSFDDVELATLLAQIAGAALLEGAGASSRVAAPAALSGELTRLADTDPVRYAALAQVVGALLAQA